jgi:hypothetical protein
MDTSVRMRNEAVRTPVHAKRAAETATLQDTMRRLTTTSTDSFSAIGTCQMRLRISCISQRLGNTGTQPPLKGVHYCFPPLPILSGNCTDGQVSRAAWFTGSWSYNFILTAVIYENKETDPDITCGSRCAFPCALAVHASQPKHSNWGLSSAAYNTASIKRALGTPCPRLFAGSF